MNDLTDYLLKLAKSQNIEWEFTKQYSNFVPRAIPDERLIIINSNWRNKNEIPFQIGHEIGHLVHNDTLTRCESPTAHYPNELSADKYSLKQIFKYNTLQNEIILEPYQFISSYGIPERLYPLTEKLFGENKKSLE